MKTKKRQKNYRVVQTPERVRATLPIFLKGLQVLDDPELIDNAFLSDVDGFLYYSGLLRTDWGLTALTSILADNITIVAAASVSGCDA